MSDATAQTRVFPAMAKFSDPDVTADGQIRAAVGLDRLETLWFNTGTLCNLTCANCYIESSPKNDRLAYITTGEVRQYLAEIAERGLPVKEIAFTGGEPFMNPEIIAILDLALSAGFRTLVLTNAMRPMMKCADGILDLHERFGGRLTLRVSLDHYQPSKHDTLRGERSWDRTIPGLRFLTEHGITTHIAGRTCWEESTEGLRTGFAAAFRELGLPIDASDPVELVLFPEMDEHADVPEITEHCWGILGIAPSDIMCATSRMVVKRKGADRPVVLPCTLLPYDREFEMGHTLEAASRAVKLNHPHCAKFCVLGGGSCSVTEA
ncbi:MAG: radical SAM protein [Alphaproteobacteria bacterium]